MKAVVPYIAAEDGETGCDNDQRDDVVAVREKRANSRRASAMTVTCRLGKSSLANRARSSDVYRTTTGHMWGPVRA